MRKLKIGDKVKIIGNGSGDVKHYYEIGEFVKVTSIKDDIIQCCDYTKHKIRQTVNVNDLELCLDLDEKIEQELNL